MDVKIPWSKNELVVFDDAALGDMQTRHSFIPLMSFTCHNEKTLCRRGCVDVTGERAARRPSTIRRTSRSMRLVDFPARRESRRVVAQHIIAASFSSSFRALRRPRPASSDLGLPKVRTLATTILRHRFIHFVLWTNDPIYLTSRIAQSPS